MATAGSIHTIAAGTALIDQLMIVGWVDFDYINQIIRLLFKDYVLLKDIIITTQQFLIPLFSFSFSFLFLFLFLSLSLAKEVWDKKNWERVTICL